MTASTSFTDAFILDAVRTPVGKIGGALARVRPDDLGAVPIAALLERSPDLDPALIDDVYYGNGNGAGEENRNVARMVSLLGGLPTSVPGVTMNRLCGSGLETVASASREIMVGDAELCIAGGVESMTRTPWVVMKPERGFERGNQTMVSTTLGWRLINPRHPDQWTVGLGEGAEILADMFSIERDDQDEFAVGSHLRAAAAWDAGRFDDEVVSLQEVALERDESMRPDASVEAMAGLRPVFRKDGSVTAGNSSPMNDGASALLLGSAAGAEAAGLEPMARIVSRAVSGIDPHLFGLGPVESTAKALDRAGLTWDDMDIVELNEAFAAQSLACLGHWPELDLAKVNPNGGAIALGHPIGASGARILTTLVHELKRSGGRYGMATMCIGVGQGIAMIIEAV